MEQLYDLKLRGNNAKLASFFYFMHSVQLIPYSSTTTVNYFASPDCGERIWHLPRSTFLFIFLRLAVSGFFYKLAERMTAASRG